MKLLGVLLPVVSNLTTTEKQCRSCLFVCHADFSMDSKIPWPHMHNSHSITPIVH